MPVSIRKLAGRIGAVVEGVDLAAPPDYSTATALRDALNEHKAVVFTGADLDNAGQERVAGWFGEPTTAHPNVPAADGTASVPAVDSATSEADEWHTDVTFAVDPPQLTTLRSYEAEHPVVRVHPPAGERGPFAVGNHDGRPRRLNRVMVAGEVPTGVDGRRSEQLDGDASHYGSVPAVAA